MRLYGPHLNPVMRTRLIAAVAIIGALYCLPAPASAQPPLGSRSFLSRHVSSVAELRRELDRDPRLIRVYSELLHMTPSQVKSEFSRLRLVRLPEEGVYKVYGVFKTPSGLQYSFKVRRLPRGIDVFTLDDGKTPVILKQCGNLLRGYYSTPGPMASSVPMFNEMYPDAGLPITPGPSPAAVTLDTPVAGEWGWVEDTASAAPPPGFYPPGGLAHAAPRAWWPWLFPLIGLPFIGAGGGGGAAGLTSFVPGAFFLPDTTSALAAVVQPSVEVPEPSAIALLASAACCGTFLLVRRSYRARKRCSRSGHDAPR
jgi:hypothetical protein